MLRCGMYIEKDIHGKTSGAEAGEEVTRGSRSRNMSRGRSRSRSRSRSRNMSRSRSSKINIWLIYFPSN